MQIQQKGCCTKTCLRPLIIFSDNCVFSSLCEEHTEGWKIQAMDPHFDIYTMEQTKLCYSENAQRERENINIFFFSFLLKFFFLMAVIN